MAMRIPMSKIALFGCGAVGSLLALNIASMDHRFCVIDDDRIDENNIGTSAFYGHHVGAQKASTLSEMIYRKAYAPAWVINQTVQNVNHTIALMDRMGFGEPDLVLDCFDNVDARGLLCGLPIPTLHVGVSRERTGAVLWDEDYTLPEGAPRGDDQFCTHQAGRAIIRATAAVAARIVEQFLDTGIKRSVILTEDFRILE
jgi:hypothetical protein